VLVVDSGDGIADGMKAALMKLGSRVRVTVTGPEERPDGSFNALVLHGSLAVDAPEWIRSFHGSKIVVENEAPNIVWADDAVHAAQSVQQLAEGEEIRRQRVGRSPWMIIVYIFAAMFGLILLLILLSIGVRLVVGL
jgi:hypothetical protein